jgi:hypothetical protein
MLWRLTLTLLLALNAHAAILADYLGTGATRVTLEKVTVSDPQLWEEYGLSAAETGRYEGPSVKPFVATAWRLKDPTGAQAAFRWLRPAAAKSGNQDALTYSKFAAVAEGLQLMTFGNYLIRFEGRVLGLEELKVFLFQLPKVDQSSLPPVLEFVPKQGLVAGTDRFIGGPVALDKFFPKLSPSAAAFHFGAEALVGKYRSGASEFDLAVFYYPTNQMARDRQPEFEKLHGAMVKRTGPLLAMILDPANKDDAERLLSQINYKAQVTINEPKPGQVIENAGDLLIAIFQLIGVLFCITIVAGVGVFAMRTLRRKAAGGEEEAMTTLHLEDHSTPNRPSQKA